MHQLDFSVTVWSESSEALLRLERMLQLPGAGELWLKRLLQTIAAGAGEVQRIDLDGFDINWDDDNEVDAPSVEVWYATKPIPRRDGSIDYSATLSDGSLTIRATGSTPEEAREAAMEMYERWELSRIELFVVQ